MQVIVDELYESWTDGNRAYVLEAVLGQPSAIKIALLSALLFSQMSINDRMVFLSMLTTRMNARD